MRFGRRQSSSSSPRPPPMMPETSSSSSSSSSARNVSSSSSSSSSMSISSSRSSSPGPSTSGVATFSLRAGVSSSSASSSATRSAPSSSASSSTWISSSSSSTSSTRLSHERLGCRDLLFEEGQRIGLVGVGRDHRTLAEIVEFLARLRADAFGAELRSRHDLKPLEAGDAPADRQPVRASHRREAAVRADVLRAGPPRSARIAMPGGLVKTRFAIPARQRARQ